MSDRDVKDIKDRLDVRELIEGYSHAVNSRDADLMGALWADDGIWLVRGKRIAGRAAILDAWRGAMASFERVFFMALPAHVRINQDKASLVTTTFEYLRPVDGPARLQGGVYIDRLVRAPGSAFGWQFTERNFESSPFDL